MTIKDPWLTVEEAARYAKCHVETIRSACRSRGIEAFRKGSRWKIRVSAVDAWIENPDVN